MRIGGMRLLTVTDWLGGGLMAAAVVGTVYLVLAALAVRRFVTAAALPIPVAEPGARRPVTILKPVCGDDPGLYDNLRSFCLQDYPGVQVVFGAHRPDDPAVAVVQRLQRELPQADLELVVDTRLHGANYKVSNLINMMAAARHELIVLADSDMRVGPDYLDAVVAPLAEPSVGLVTCLYRGQPHGGLWSTLAAMFVNHGFLPSVLVGQWVGARDGCFGATIALRRETLERIGGFEAVRDYLADDYALGAAVRRLGLTVHLSHHVVDHQMREPDLPSLIRHELRWARTLRAIEPGGFAASLVTFPLLPGLLAVLVTGASAISLAVLALVLAGRYGLMTVADRALGVPGARPWQAPWLAPLRDLLSAGVLIASFCITSVTWRQQRFRVGPDGRLTVDGDLPA